jgi:26S proteasome regulatory subunit N1
MNVKISALFGLGLVAAGTQNEKLMNPLLEVIQDFSYGFEVSAFVSLALGLIFIGSSSEDVFSELFSILLSRNEYSKGKIFESPFFVIYVLGIGLLCLGKQKDNDFMIETMVTVESFSKEMKDYLNAMLISFSYAGSGNVSKVQELMQIIAKPTEEVNPKVQSISVIGCSLIAMGEEVGTEMLSRSFNHFLQFGDINIKKTVSLAMALLNLSNPKVNVIDSLTKFCYDTDKMVAMNAIFSMGLVSSGSNHSRVAGLLRSLASYYNEETNPLFMVRISQGLLHMGKGIITLDPVYSHKLLINNIGIAGVLITLFAFTETERLMCEKYQYLVYSLVLGMRPKLVMTVDENLQPKEVQLMIGQAIDIAGQTGNPRTISGFQTHTSPAVINTGERCEINGEDFIPYSDVLEGIVIVKEKERKEKQN